MPAAALLGLAVWLLARDAGAAAARRAGRLRARAWGSPPTCARSRCRWCCWRRCTFARGAPRWVHVITRTLAACFVAFLVLLPWGVRNHLRYGELFLTDSHGGHTALVGANPNTDGRYSRSLNRLFAEGTGYALFAPPHRDVGSRRLRAGQAVDGLLAALRARPARRQGRSPAGRRAPAALLAALPRRACCRRAPGSTSTATGVERVVDDSWYLFVAAIAVGIVAAAARRNWPALTLLPLPLALAVALHAVLRRGPLPPGDRRPPAAVRGRGARLGRPRPARRHPPPDARGGRAGDRGAGRGGRRGRDLRRLAAPGRRAGDRLRENNRWAVCVCEVAGAKRLCDVRATEPAPGADALAGARASGTDSACVLSGAARGGGLRRRSPRRALTGFPCAPRRLRGRPSTRPSIWRPTGRNLAQTSWPTEATPITLAGVVPHPGGKLRVELRSGARNFNRHRRRWHPMDLRRSKLSPIDLDA